MTPVVLRGRWTLTPVRGSSAPLKPETEIHTMQRATPAFSETPRALDKKDPAREFAAPGLVADLSAAKRVSFKTGAKNGVARAA